MAEEKRHDDPGRVAETLATVKLKKGKDGDVVTVNESDAGAWLKNGYKIVTESEAPEE